MASARTLLLALLRINNITEPYNNLDNTPAGHQETKSRNVREGDEPFGTRGRVEEQHTPSPHLDTLRCLSLPVAEHFPQMQSGRQRKFIFFQLAQCI